ncbi:hypothetical protein DICVIV_08317 [Dictyocaulus viviparus]|uniref:Uncharacterized protein n=1 Tax=Dictyocaulus viviparus TaxID=29172 RepID=A0A0D8XPA7_DICVI|nr:hypothetical protein DICVIV_08317 [Dictyocaulus viviparus]
MQLLRRKSQCDHDDDVIASNRFITISEKICKLFDLSWDVLILPLVIAYRFKLLNNQRQHLYTVSAEVYTTSQRVALQRRYSTYQEIDANDEQKQLMDLDRILNSRKDGIEIAFERTKAWSKHPFMPLRDVFESSFDSDIDLVDRTKETTDHLKARVVEALDARRKEHDLQRGALKLEWTKLTKSLHDSEDMVEKCRATLKLRQEAVRKARENALRSESVTVPPSVSTDPMKRRREMEKKKRIEEEAVIKKAEAEKQLAMSTAELRRKRKELECAKVFFFEMLIYF